MGKMEILLTKELIDSNIREFDKEEKKVEDTLEFIIKQYPNNTDIKEVMIKVAVIDSLYSSQLYRSIKSDNSDKRIHYIEVISKRIMKIKQLDDMLLSEDKRIRMKAIRRIADAEESNYNRTWSFASKYCNWHNHEGFAIYDKYSRGTIYSIYKTKANGLSGKNVTYDKVLDYASYYDICEELIVVIKERFKKKFF